MEKYPFYFIFSIFLAVVLTIILPNGSFPVSAADSSASALYGGSGFQQKMKRTRSYSVKIRPAASSGCIYYTARNGKNSNPGIRKKPFGDIQTGIKHLKKGDTLVIRKGTSRKHLPFLPKALKLPISPYGMHHILFTHSQIKNITVPKPAIPGHCANGILLLKGSASKSIHNIFL